VNVYSVLCVITSSVIFSARAAAYIARYRHMLLPVRLSVCLSVSPSHRWITLKRLKSGRP